MDRDRGNRPARQPNLRYQLRRVHHNSESSAPEGIAARIEQTGEESATATGRGGDRHPAQAWPSWSVLGASHAYRPLRFRLGATTTPPRAAPPGPPRPPDAGSLHTDRRRRLAVIHAPTGATERAPRRHSGLPSAHRRGHRHRMVDRRPKTTTIRCGSSHISSKPSPPHCRPWLSRPTCGTLFEAHGDHACPHVLTTLINYTARSVDQHLALARRRLASGSRIPQVWRR